MGGPAPNSSSFPKAASFRPTKPSSRTVPRVPVAMGSRRLVIVASRVLRSGCFASLRVMTDLPRRVDLRELTTSAVRAAICKPNGDAPLAANAEVCAPPRLTVVVGVSPPALDLVRGEGAKNALGRPGNLRPGDGRAAPASATGSAYMQP